MKNIFKITIGFLIIALAFSSCNNGESKSNSALSSNVAEKVYVAPGEHDEFYAFISGGFSGQLSVYGLPSGRLFKVIPVFSVDAEKAWGFNEETKPMLNTSHGFIPWDDSHHPDISQTNGELDGRWVFINGNNTPRIAKIDLTTFETTEIIEVPNSAGNHSSSFVTENTEYVVAGTRFSVPFPQRDMPISEYKGNFKGALTFISVDPEDGGMDIKFQIRMPGFDYDLSHPGRGDSHGWFFFTTYNTEEANSLLEVNASQNDKDFIAAVNWKKAEEYAKSGKGTHKNVRYAHNYVDESTQTAISEIKTDVFCKPHNDTGNIFVEFECRGKESGIMVTEAKWFVTYFKHLNEIWYIKTSELLSLIETSNFRTTQFSGDSGSNTKGYLIPRYAFKEKFIIRKG